MNQTLSQALSIGDLHRGWFDTTDNRRRPGIRALAYAVMMAPTLFVHQYIELRPADEVAVSLLFMLSGFASCTLSGIMATLAYLDRPGRPAPASPHPAARRAPRLVGFIALSRGRDLPRAGGFLPVGHEPAASATARVSGGHERSLACARIVRGYAHPDAG